MIIGAMAAPVFHDVTDQYEFGIVTSLMAKSALMMVAAAVMDVELMPTMKVLWRGLVRVLTG